MILRSSSGEAPPLRIDTRWSSAGGSGRDRGAFVRTAWQITWERNGVHAWFRQQLRVRPETSYFGTLRRTR